MIAQVKGGSNFEQLHEVVEGSLSPSNLATRASYEQKMTALVEQEGTPELVASAFMEYEHLNPTLVFGLGILVQRSMILRLNNADSNAVFDLGITSLSGLLDWSCRFPESHSIESFTREWLSAWRRVNGASARILKKLLIADKARAFPVVSAVRAGIELHNLPAEPDAGGSDGPNAAALMRCAVRLGLARDILEEVNAMNLGTLHITAQQDLGLKRSFEEVLREFLYCALAVLTLIKDWPLTPTVEFATLEAIELVEMFCDWIFNHCLSEEWLYPSMIFADFFMDMFGHLPSESPPHLSEASPCGTPRLFLVPIVVAHYKKLRSTKIASSFMQPVAISKARAVIVRVCRLKTRRCMIKETNRVGVWMVAAIGELLASQGEAVQSGAQSRNEAQEELSHLVSALSTLFQNPEFDTIGLMMETGTDLLPRLTSLFRQLVHEVRTDSELFPALELTIGLIDRICTIAQRAAKDSVDHQKELIARGADEAIAKSAREVTEVLLSSGNLLALDCRDDDGDDIVEEIDRRRWYDKRNGLMELFRSLGVVGRRDVVHALELVQGALAAVEQRVRDPSVLLSDEEMDILRYIFEYLNGLLLRYPRGSSRVFSYVARIPSSFRGEGSRVAEIQRVVQTTMRAVPELLLVMIDSYQGALAAGAVEPIRLSGCSELVMNAAMVMLTNTTAGYLFSNLKYEASFPELTEPGPAAMETLDRIVRVFIRLIQVDPAGMGICENAAMCLKGLANPSKPVGLYLSSCPAFREMGSQLSSFGLNSNLTDPNTGKMDPTNPFAQLLTGSTGLRSIRYLSKAVGRCSWGSRHEKLDGEADGRDLEAIVGVFDPMLKAFLNCAAAIPTVPSFQRFLIVWLNVLYGLVSTYYCWGVEKFSSSALDWFMQESDSGLRLPQAVLLYARRYRECPEVAVSCCKMVEAILRSLLRRMPDMMKSETMDAVDQFREVFRSYEEGGDEATVYKALVKCCIVVQDCVTGGENQEWAGAFGIRMLEGVQPTVSILMTRGLEDVGHGTFRLLRAVCDFHTTLVLRELSPQAFRTYLQLLVTAATEFDDLPNTGAFSNSAIDSLSALSFGCLQDIINEGRATDSGSCPEGYPVFGAIEMDANAGAIPALEGALFELLRRSTRYVLRTIVRQRDMEDHYRLGVEVLLFMGARFYALDACIQRLANEFGGIDQLVPVANACKERISKMVSLKGDSSPGRTKIDIMEFKRNDFKELWSNFVLTNRLVENP